MKSFQRSRCSSAHVRYASQHSVETEDVLLHYVPFVIRARFMSLNRARIVSRAALLNVFPVLFRDSLLNPSDFFHQFCHEFHGRHVRGLA